jgi:hypothetical protein
VNDLLSRVVTDEQSKFSLKLQASTVWEFMNIMLEKLPKENRRSDMSGSSGLRLFDFLEASGLRKLSTSNLILKPVNP